MHIVTVNDYLARRDAAWMGQIYHALCLTVGIINHESSFIFDPSHVTVAEEKEEDATGSFKVGSTAAGPSESNALTLTISGSFNTK